MVCCKSHINEFSFPPSDKMISKPWGFYIEHYRADDGSVCFKTLAIKPQCQISVQYHKERAEFWWIPDSNAKFELTLAENKAVHEGVNRIDIPLGYIHCIKNLSDKMLYIHETQYGNCFESDIVRLSDPYANLR